ncbi:hypothetical protein Hamer_G007821 [Homarus americanus]|uniref:Uncharacterized protein n=1 Tax=Homarus americanus TaxID=6706 RepID=A0A8J5MSW1_HOMAM|nr:hypothetical protein Hamer_G007821 [Homarus americanus]
MKRRNIKAPTDLVKRFKLVWMWVGEKNELLSLAGGAVKAALSRVSHPHGSVLLFTDGTTSSTTVGVMVIREIVIFHCKNIGLVHQYPMRKQKELKYWYRNHIIDGFL